MSSSLHSPRSSEVSLTSAFTAALWLSCAAVSAIGIVIPYSKFKAPAEESIVQAQLLNVELAAETIVPAEETPAPTLDSAPPPPAAEPLSVPSAQPLIAVAEPQAVAFALPVAGPVRVVEAKAAAYSAPVQQQQTLTAQPTVAPLTFGVGEGKQATPDYPARARYERQEGVVRVQFTVTEDGRPIAVELSGPSPWPLLNQSALKTIREKWRFAAGPVRRYEVPINFQLTRK